MHVTIHLLKVILESLHYLNIIASGFLNNLKFGVSNITPNNMLMRFETAAVSKSERYLK